MTKSTLKGRNLSEHAVYIKYMAKWDQSGYGGFIGGLNHKIIMRFNGSTRLLYHLSLDQFKSQSI